MSRLYNLGFRPPELLSEKPTEALLKLGAPKRDAYMWSYTRKGPMAVARSWILCRTITNEVLKIKGLVSLSEHYQLVHNF